LNSESTHPFGQDTRQERADVRREFQSLAYRQLVGSVRKRIALRVGIATVLLVVIAGFLAYGYWIETMNQSMTDYGREHFAPLLQELRDSMAAGQTMNSARLEQILQSAIEQKAGSSKGRFIYLAAFDLKKNPLAHAVRPDLEPHGQLESRLNSSPQRFSDSGDLWSGRIPSEGAVRIQMSGSFRNAAGEPIGYLDVAYEADPGVVSAGRKTLLRIVLLVTGIVLLTGLLLYPVSMSLVHRLTGAVVRLTQSHFEVLMVLSGAIAKRDRETSEHNFRVTLMAVRLAEAARLHPGDIPRIFKGAIIHDVGKIGEHDAILLKEGPLNKEEFEEMKQHVFYGWEIIQSSPWLVDGADIVRYHHEKYDGSGYLEGLAGEAIPLPARIFAIVDVFDALTARRPYKEPMSLEKTLEILRKGRGTHFDPVFLDLFLGIAPSIHTAMTDQTKAQIEKELVRMVRTYFVESGEPVS